MKNLFWIVCTVALFASCQEDVTEGKKQYPQEEVSMSFALQAGGMSQPEYGRTAGTRAAGHDGMEVTLGQKPGTRAAETLPIESVMKDLMVMQFAGEGDDAALMGTPQYFPQYDAEPAAMSFIASNGDRHTIYFVANGGKDLGPDITGKTLGDFKRMVHDIPVEIKLVAGQGVLMTGAWVGPISNDADVKEVILTRAMAKISFHLTNSLKGGYIQSVSVEGVPASVNYTGLTDNTSANQLYYPTKTYDGETEYTWYVPENLNTTKEKSTCVMVTVGVTGSTMVYPCRIYLNATEENPDYTLKRNHSYAVSVKLTGTSSTEGELLVDCHYVRGEVPVAKGAVVTSDANWIDVSTLGAWAAGLTQTVTATGTTVYLHIDDNLTDADRRATVTVTEGIGTRTIPVRQKAIQKVGFFGAPDADGIYTQMLGMEMIEENSYQLFCTGVLADFLPLVDREVIYSGLDITNRYGNIRELPVFNYCYEKNKDKSNIQWYVPALAQMIALYVGQPVYGLIESGADKIKGGYYAASVNKNAGPVYYIFDTGYNNSLTAANLVNRNMRCVRDMP